MHTDLDASYTSLPECIRHEHDDVFGSHAIIINLASRAVAFEVVLASRDGVECNSVNHLGKDPAHSNCAPPYPFEHIVDMLRRHRHRGALAVINTDYFGPDGDHGAQGLVVKNGVRMDGPMHGVGNDIALTSPCLAISDVGDVCICAPGCEEIIERELATTFFNATSGWPIIVQNGQRISDACQSAPYGPSGICDEPGRSAVGLTRDGALILITTRATATQTADYLIQRFGVNTALSFDGGRSATMAWVNADGVIHQFCPLGESRAVAVGLIVLQAASPKTDEP